MKKRGKILAVLAISLIEITTVQVFAQPTRAAGNIPVNGSTYISLVAVDQMVLEYMKANNIPGATVAITKGGRLVLSKGYGYAHTTSKLPMLATHRTFIGSVSKLLTTAAVMKLHENPNNGFSVERKLYGAGGLFQAGEYAGAIAKAVQTKLPPPGSSRGIQAQTWYFQTQIKHLLSHSSGWDGSWSGGDTAKYFKIDKDKVTPRLNHLAFISTHVPSTPPGARYNYLNRNVGMMDHVIESCSGEKYADYVKQHILHPIGLTRVAAVGDPATKVDAYKHVYAKDGKSYLPTVLVPGKGTGSAGGWRASATDLARFMVATDRLSNHSDILSPATLDLMETPPFPKTVPTRALGWGVLVKGSSSWLTHAGKLEGGTAYVGKGTPGYIAGDGSDLSHVSVAICVNIRNSSGQAALVVELARLAGKATIPSFYDLFN